MKDSFLLQIWKTIISTVSVRKIYRQKTKNTHENSEPVAHGDEVTRANISSSGKKVIEFRTVFLNDIL